MQSLNELLESVTYFEGERGHLPMHYATELARRLRVIVGAVEKASHHLDLGLGDSDLPDDESDFFVATQVLNKVLQEIGVVEGGIDESAESK